MPSTCGRVQASPNAGAKAQSMICMIAGMSFRVPGRQTNGRCAVFMTRDARRRHDHKADVAATEPSERAGQRSEEHTSELQSLMRKSYAVFCLKKKKNKESNQRYYQMSKNDNKQAPKMNYYI